MCVEKVSAKLMVESQTSFYFSNDVFQSPLFYKKNDVCARGFLSYHGGMKVNQKKRRVKREEEYNKFVFYYY